MIVELSDAAAREFGKLTATVVGDKIAILFDGRVLSAPVVASAIDRGRVWITADGEPDLAIVLASGALPAPMRMERVAEIVGDKLRAVDHDGNPITVPR